MIDPMTVALLVVILSPLVFMVGYQAALDSVKRGEHVREGYRYSYLESRAHAERVAAQEVRHG